MTHPIANRVDLSTIPVPNRFGARRKFDVHTGLDLFAPVGEPVYACEDGFVMDVCTFTGASIDMPWWNETKCVSILGQSGVILYGEIDPTVEVGQFIQEGVQVGTVLQVLIKDKGKPMSMLHIELYDADYKGKGFEKNVWEAWELDGDIPPRLQNIEKLLYPEWFGVDGITESPGFHGWSSDLGVCPDCELGEGHNSYNMENIF